MDDGVEYKTIPPDLQQRIAKYESKVKTVILETNKASLYTLWEKVPAYPERPNSTYIRTGTLGRTLGVGMSGGQLGQPEIFKQAPLGQNGQEATFGTRLEYAGDVIGEGTQKAIHQGIWWTMRTVLDRAMEKVLKLHTIAAEELVKYLSGQG